MLIDYNQVNDVKAPPNYSYKLDIRVGSTGSYITKSLPVNAGVAGWSHRQVDFSIPVTDPSSKLDIKWANDNGDANLQINKILLYQE